MAIFNSKLQKTQRFAVVQQPSMEIGHIEISYKCSANTLYYEVKKHPLSGIMTLYLYPTRMSLMYHTPKDRVYQCVLTDLNLIPQVIKRLHKVNRPLHNWGTPYMAMPYQWTTTNGVLQTPEQILLAKIAELRDWACENGYPLHEVLEEEYNYYEKSFNELNS